MSKQRGTFFGKQDDRNEENQKYGSPIFIPKRKKLKGYQKKSEISSFNKNR